MGIFKWFSRKRKKDYSVEIESFYDEKVVLNFNEGETKTFGRGLFEMVYPPLNALSREHVILSVAGDLVYVELIGKFSSCISSADNSKGEKFSKEGGKKLILEWV